ncbi:hypothetical protein, partial [Pseudorhodobacter antarcticus]|uniref:hypothetical protein n=1 Tax=Pseudorhodobacter antarcticus TaxID=1077947 RepID=UPI001FD26B75
MLSDATRYRASPAPFFVASGKPLRLNQRTAAVISVSAIGRGVKVERGTVEPGIGEVVLVLRPHCSPFKVDHGFISGCHSH